MTIRALPRLSRAVLLAGACLLSACAHEAGGSSGGVAAASKTAWPVKSDVVAAPAFSSEGLAALEARMKQAVDNGEVAGLSFALVKDGKLQDMQYYGAQSFGGPPVTADTIFRIRSMSKPITGVAMMQLWEQGKFQLDDPVTKYVPEFANLKVYVSGSAEKGDLVTEPVKTTITMRDLFTHTAGFGYGLSAASEVDRMFIAENPMGKPDMKSMVKRVADIPLLAQPQTKWSYSIAIDVQGAIVERLSGMSFGEYLEKNIFSPLGMKDSGFWLTEAEKPRFATVYTRNAETGKMEVYPDSPDRSFFKKDHEESGGGGLTSTLHDYTRFVQMLINDGELDGKRILKADTVKLMMQNHLPNGVSAAGGGWGLGGAVATNPPSERNPQPQGTFSWFGIDGTWFWVDPVNDLGFVGMIQRRGNAGPGGVNMRGESPQLVYSALNK